MNSVVVPDERLEEEMLEAVRRRDRPLVDRLLSEHRNLTWNPTIKKLTRDEEDWFKRIATRPH